MRKKKQLLIRKYDFLSIILFWKSINSLEVPSSSTKLNYHGQTIDVSTKTFDTIRVLGRGCYGYVLDVRIEGYPDVRMAVKVIE